jgi:ribonuclease HI
LFDKDEQNYVQCRTITLSFLDEEYPQDLWIRVYTDGSAQNSIENGGAGVYIEYPNKTTETIRVPTGKFCHNYGAEIQAIKVRKERLLNINHSTQPVVILTDARSALQALQSRKLFSYKYNCLNCVTSEKSLCNGYHLIMEYQETRKTDRQAKEGAREKQPDSHVPSEEKDD